MDLDAVRLHFNPQSLIALNAILGLVMFGVALDLRVEDFRRVVRSPRGPLIGLGAQFVLLPALTFVLTLFLRPLPSIALGMLLVAACPGGNVSNFITHLAAGNTALSVSMTALSSALALVMTPLNLTFWGKLNPHTAPLLTSVSLNPLQVMATIFLILGLPLAAGMSIAHRRPQLAARLRRPFRIFSIFAFVLFVAIAFAANFDYFQKFVLRVFFYVLLHNAGALFIGYLAARAFGMSIRDRRAVSIEVGIQNSGLGLALIFNFFSGLGGMAVTAAWWGIWHLIAGMSLAFYWSRKPAT